MRRARADLRLTFAVLAVGVTSFGLLQSLVLPILPTVQHQFGSTQNTVTWVLTAYLLSATVATPIVGRVGDMFGKDRVLFATLLVLAIGCVAAALAPTVGWLIAARGVQGVGGGVLPLTFGIIGDEFPPVRVAGAIGAMAGLLAFGGGLGAVLAGPIVAMLDFGWLFWISLAVLVPAAVAVRSVVPPSPVRWPGRIDRVSAVLVASGLISLLLAISQGPSWGWASTACLVLDVVAVILLAGWVANELHSRDPLIDIRMLSLPTVATTNAAALLFGVGQFAIVGFLPEFVQAPRRAGYGFASSVTESCLFLLPQTMGMFAFGLLSGRVSARLGAKATVLIGTATGIVPYVLFAEFGHAKWQIYLASGFMGISFGLAISGMATIIVAAVPPSQTGVASGMSANVRTLGGCVGSAVLSSMVAGGLRVGEVPTATAWRAGFWFLAISAAGAFVAAAVVPAHRFGADGGRRNGRSPGLVPTSGADISAGWSPA
jgi:MFS family permease